MPAEKKTEKKNDIVGKSPEELKEEMQKKALQFQILQSSMQIIREKENMLMQRLEEMDNTRHAIEDVKSVKAGSEMLVPLGSGNFIAGKISGTEKVLVGVGGGIAIKKSVDGALESLNSRMKEMESALVELRNQGVQIGDELRMLQSEMKMG